METVAVLLYDHFKHFTATWYVLKPFGNFVVILFIFPRLVHCTTKNLATLLSTCR
jgi:hypothetical protein